MRTAFEKHRDFTGVCAWITWGIALYFFIESYIKYSPTMQESMWMYILSKSWIAVLIALFFTFFYFVYKKAADAPTELVRQYEDKHQDIFKDLGYPLEDDLNNTKGR